MLQHDIEDAWRLQEGSLGCLDAKLLEGLPATGARVFGESCAEKNRARDGVLGAAGSALAAGRRGWGGGQFTAQAAEAPPPGAG